MRRIHCLIKPVSGNCNMQCKYCFYKDEIIHRNPLSSSKMNFATMENLIKKSLTKETKSCTFAFQGGEPTLAGLDYFQEFIEVVKRVNIYQCEVNYALQTNGYQLDENWIDFFKENHFLIGISLDGTKVTHDQYRRTFNGEDTYNEVVKTIRQLQNKEVDFNVLTVVNRDVAKNIKEIYHFYRAQNFKYQQYIPCFDPLFQKRGNYDYSLTPALYTLFLKDLFDCWYEDLIRGKTPYNRYFENILGLLMGYHAEQCGLFGHCMNQYVFEADGSVYPCDFYALEEYCLGNINQDNFTNFDRKRILNNFIDFSKKKEEACNLCAYYPLCKGGCRRDRQQADGTLAQNYFCQTYKDFFEYTLPRFNEIAHAIRIKPQDKS